MRMTIMSTVVASGLILSGCAGNYAGEGALAGGAIGAGVGAVSDGDVGESAAIGAAAGAVGGALIKKDRKGCYRYDHNGYRFWDEDC